MQLVLFSLSLHVALYPSLFTAVYPCHHQGFVISTLVPI
jgi:hypothetical protein